MAVSVENPLPIVAEPYRVEEGVIRGRLYDTVITTLGGTMLLSELAEDSIPHQYEPRAIASFQGGHPVDYRSSKHGLAEEQPPWMEPVMFNGNGGPSAPGVLLNSQIFSGDYYVQHDSDGYLPEAPRVVECSYSPYRFFKAVVHTDPVGTGLGEMLPDQDPTWALSATRDVQIATALKLGYLQLAGLERHPLMTTVSSYGVQREAGSTIDMARLGRPIDSLTIIGGAYDRQSIKYTPDAVLPYVALLPSLAVANYYHEQSMIPDGHWKVDISPPYELFRVVATFAQSEYAEALRNGDVANKDIIEQLHQCTGLPHDLIADNGSRISPRLFQTHRLPGRYLSAVDSRLCFPDDQEIVIDPALDRWQPVYRRLLAENTSYFGYPGVFSNNYKGIMVAADDWRFDGRWKDENVHDAMEELLTVSPTTTLLDVSGIYDLMRPALWSEWFWTDMQRRTGVTCSRSVGTTINPIAYRSRVDMRLLAMGHQLTRPIPDKARQMVSNGIMQQLITCMRSRASQN